MDKSHATHIGGELINLSRRTIFKSKRFVTIFGFAQIKHQKFIRRRGREFRLFDIDAAHPISFALEALD